MKAYAIADSFSIHLVHPDNDAIVSSLKSDSDLTEYVKIELAEDGKKVVLWVKKKAEIDISDLERAHLEFSPLTPSLRLRGEKSFPQIHIWFTPHGSKKWADFTTRNAKKRTVFVLDGIALRAPVIFEPITSGRTTVAGDFSEKQAKEIVDRINDLIDRNRAM